jgi:hypothetical protein
VEDIDKANEELIKRGVHFEHYDEGDLKATIREFSAEKGPT